MALWQMGLGCQVQIRGQIGFIVLLPKFLPISHLKYMVSNFNLFEGFFMENKWSQIGQTLW
jgi:hypothetical protein